MEWNKPIPELNIEKLVPEPGCLVEWEGEWKLVVGTSPDIWHPTYGDGCGLRWRGLGSSNAPLFEHELDCTPILPKVPAGKTCWDVWNAMRPWGAFEHTVVMQTPDGLEWSSHTFHTAAQQPAHMRDMQKYGALLEWIAVNGGA